MKKLVLLFILLISFLAEAQQPKVERIRWKGISEASMNALVVPANEFWEVTLDTGVKYQWDGDSWEVTGFQPSTLLTDYGFTDNSNNWNDAYSWGNHANEGYLTQLEGVPYTGAVSDVDLNANNLTNVWNFETIGSIWIRGNNNHIAINDGGSGSSVISTTSLYGDVEKVKFRKNNTVGGSKYFEFDVTDIPNSSTTTLKIPTANGTIATEEYVAANIGSIDLSNYLEVDGDGSQLTNVQVIGDGGTLNSGVHRTGTNGLVISTGTGGLDVYGSGINFNAVPLTSSSTATSDDNLVNKLYVDNAVSGSDFSEFMINSGTRAGGNMISKFGDYDNTGLGTHIEVDNNSEFGGIKLISEGFASLELNGEDKSIFTRYGHVTQNTRYNDFDGTGFITDVVPNPNATGNYSLYLPNLIANDTLATKSDLDNIGDSSGFFVFNDTEIDSDVTTELTITSAMNGKIINVSGSGTLVATFPDYTELGYSTISEAEGFNVVFNILEDATIQTIYTGTFTAPYVESNNVGYSDMLSMYINTDGEWRPNGSWQDYVYTPPSNTPVIESFTEAYDYDGTTHSISIDKPTAIENGDLLLIIVGNSPTSSTTPWDDTTNKPNGFDLVKTDGLYQSHLAVFSRIADGTESASSTITDVAGVDTESYAIYLRISGADTTTPIGVIGTSLASTGSDPIVVPSITTVNDNSLIIAAATVNGTDTYTHTVTGTGWSKLMSVTANSGGGYPAGTIAIKEQTTAGATGDCTIDIGMSERSVSWQFSINPNL